MRNLVSVAQVAGLRGAAHPASSYDIRIERENFRFYFPLVACLLLSLALSLVLWLVRLFRG